MTKRIQRLDMLRHWYFVITISLEDKLLINFVCRRIRRFYGWECVISVKHHGILRCTYVLFKKKPSRFISNLCNAEKMVCYRKVIVFSYVANMQRNRSFQITGYSNYDCLEIRRRYHFGKEFVGRFYTKNLWITNWVLLLLPKYQQLFVKLWYYNMVL